MNNKKQLFWIFTTIILIMLFFGPLIIGRADAAPKLSQSPPMENVVIDGIINETEWVDRDWTISFFLDIDDVGNPPDQDGTNYLYLGEDRDNMYIGLDLCSDQTNNETGEWISLWLNLFNRSFTTYEEWSNFLNNGTESLIHDVENDKPWQFFDYSGLNNKPVNFNDDSEINAIDGNIEGNYSLLDINVSNPNFFITSVKNGSDHIARVDFSIDARKWYLPGLAGIFLTDLQRVSFEISNSVNTSITENKLILWYLDGTWDETDPDQVFPINNETAGAATTFWYEKGNITTDNRIQFSLVANHNAPFKIRIPWFIFKAVNHFVRPPHSSVNYPHSSLIDYNIAWGFNSSTNNPANHRMFEFGIPKSSLEHYDSDGDIGIMIGGYGTLSFTNSSYWVYSKDIHQITEEQSKDYYYYNMLGIDFPMNGGGETIIGYHVLLLIGIMGICSIFLIRKKLKTS